MRNKTGFTLVELLVVISLIGFLTAILLPAIAKVKDRAIKTKVRSTVERLAMALVTYQSEHGEYPPDGIDNNNAALPSGIEGNVEGIFVANEKSRYVDGALVRYLDGDAENDANKNPSKPQPQYFEFLVQNMGKGADNNHPTFLSAYGTPFFYNELESEGRVKKYLDATHRQDPQHNFVRFRSFQIYNKVNQEENPELWISNIRDK